MKTLKTKYIAIISASVLLAAVSVFAITTEFAYAWNTTQWRPSVEIKKSIDSSYAKISEYNDEIEDSKNFIEDYENNAEIYEEDVRILQSKVDEMEKYIKIQKPEIEEVTKNSYAAFFAKGLLDEMVGNRFVTDGLFRWSFVTFFACGEDDEIMNFVEDYYNTKKELDSATNENEEATAKYNQSLSNIQNLPNEINALNTNIDNLNNLLVEVLEIEQVFGAAGESRIEGSNFFCHPCPDSQISSPFGESRDGYTHHGCDFVAASGTPIYCAADGVVFDTGQSDSMGNYVKIQHADGFVSVYMHCSHVFVPNGMQVFRGDNIALVGSTGDSEAPHLHFQVELNGTPVNCLDYM